MKLLFHLPRRVIGKNDSERRSESGVKFKYAARTVDPFNHAFDDGSLTFTHPAMISKPYVDEIRIILAARILADLHGHSIFGAELSHRIFTTIDEHPSPTMILDNPVSTFIGPKKNFLVASIQTFHIAYELDVSDASSRTHCGASY